MKIFPAIIFGICLLIFISCKEEPQVQAEMETVAPEASSFFFIRHAEKDSSNPEDPDPELDQKGLGRAMHWAEIFNDVPLDAIYSTDYARTSMTAAPTAVKQDITVQYYNPESLDIQAFLTENSGKNVLVVGHSNTTPDLINRMIGEERYGMMEEDDNGSLFVVTRIGTETTVQRLHFNCNCPE